MDAADDPDAPEAIDQATLALETYGALGDEDGIAQALLRLSNSHGMTGDRDAAFADARQALEHARTAGDETLAGFALTHMAIATVRIEDALPLLDEGVAALRRGGAISRIPALSRRSGSTRPCRGSTSTHAACSPRR